MRHTSGQAGAQHAAPYIRHAKSCCLGAGRGAGRSGRQWLL